MIAWLRSLPRKFYDLIGFRAGWVVVAEPMPDRIQLEKGFTPEGEAMLNSVASVSFFRSKNGLGRFLVLEFVAAGTYQRQLIGINLNDAQLIGTGIERVFNEHYAEVN
jgi:hypothetical protein